MPSLRKRRGRMLNHISAWFSQTMPCRNGYAARMAILAGELKPGVMKTNSLAYQYAGNRKSRLATLFCKCNQLIEAFRMGIN